MTPKFPPLSPAPTALLAIAALLAGCQHRPPPPVPDPPRQVESGSTFVLNSPLAFAPGSATLLFQNQQVVAPAQVSREAPLCRLTAAPGAARALVPGRFSVGPTSYEERETGVPGAMSTVTHIALAREPQQPGYTLSCGWPPEARSGGFLTTQQIFDAIGGQFSMDLRR